MKANFHIWNDDELIPTIVIEDTSPAESVTFEIEKTKVAKLLGYICMILWFSPKLY